MREEKDLCVQELESGVVLCSNVWSKAGFLPEVYLGPGGIFVCMQQCDNPRESFISLRSTLKIPRIALYLAGKGLYDSTRDIFHSLGHLSTEEFQIPPPMHLVMHNIGPDRFRRNFSPEEVTQFCHRLVRSDALTRGRYLDENGRLYLRHGDGFREVSRKNSDILYLSALFGGVLGLHRFLLGKWCTGIVYACTGGLFLMGYASDLLFLLLGIVKDRNGRILSPLCNRMRNMVLLAPGVLFSAFMAHRQVNTFLTIASALQRLLTQSANRSSDVLADLFQRILPLMQ